MKWYGNNIFNYRDEMIIQKKNSLDGKTLILVLIRLINLTVVHVSKSLLCWSLIKKIYSFMLRKAEVN